VSTVAGQVVTRWPSRHATEAGCIRTSAAGGGVDCHQLEPLQQHPRQQARCDTRMSAQRVTTVAIVYTWALQS
jgi:hypothetical protein